MIAIRPDHVGIEIRCKWDLVEIRTANSTIIDVIAVGSYLLAGLPLIWIALQEVGIIGSGKSDTDKLRVHAICVAIFLVVGHIAMIFGMLDPAILGFTPPDAMMNMDHGSH